MPSWNYIRKFVLQTSKNSALEKQQMQRATVLRRFTVFRHFIENQLRVKKQP
ncbi:hypothetical protein HUS2011_pII0034 (plasmid) [Escherichia coli]|nr:hypothetical protein HUS2011_pII0034 [Escherichia coli]